MFRSSSYMPIAMMGVTLVIIVIVTIAYILYRVFKSPFEYPYFVYRFDVSGKRNVRIDDCIDRFLCDDANWKKLQLHQSRIEFWKQRSLAYLNKCRFKNLRMEQYRAAIDDGNAFRFETVRGQTRYRQYNYVRTAYKVQSFNSACSVSWWWLERRHQQLKEINFEATLHDYECKSQRKLMTKTLRKQIMERDNYTCRICGKYMPDEVGLHIDHIIPVAKGGKTVPSNLQVLCSKCNGRKSAK